MSNPAKHPSILGDLGDLGQNARKASAATVEAVTSNKPAKGESELFRTSIMMNRKVHDRLREIAFAERSSITALLMEGIDSVLKARMHPSVGELSGQSEA